MKETLDEQSRFGLMRYRMERADETMEKRLGFLPSEDTTTLLSTACIMPVSMPCKPYC